VRRNCFELATEANCPRAASAVAAAGSVVAMPTDGRRRRALVCNGFVCATLARTNIDRHKDRQTDSYRQTDGRTTATMTGRRSKQAKTVITIPSPLCCVQLAQVAEEYESIEAVTETAGLENGK